MKAIRARAFVAALACSAVGPSAFAVCDFGPDTCLPGFVWREAFPGDHVCVTGDTRTESANENSLAAQRRSPTGGPFGPDTCLPGFVWREASPSDHVCVPGSSRDRAALDNAQASARRDPQCATPVPGNDASPPGFIQTTITFHRASDGFQVGNQVVPPAGLTVSPVPRDRRFVIATTAADNESGVSDISAATGASWSCTSLLTGLAISRTPILDGRSDETRNGTSASGSPLLRSAHFSIDPFDANPLRLVCPTDDDASALTVRTTLTAVNGNAAAITSGPIVVVYAPRLHTGLPLGAVCGDNARGVFAVCTTGTTCGFRQTKVCDGWWIFSRCDYIKSTEMFCQ